jgi:hypothetical protein
MLQGRGKCSQVSERVASCGYFHYDMPRKATNQVPEDFRQPNPPKIILVRACRASRDTAIGLTPWSVINGTEDCQAYTGGTWQGLLTLITLLHRLSLLLQCIADITRAWDRSSGCTTPVTGSYWPDIHGYRIPHRVRGSPGLQAALVSKMIAKHILSQNRRNLVH